MRWLAVVGVTLGLSSCGTPTATTLPNQGSLLPNATVQVTPTVAYTTQQIYNAGIVGALIYIVYDPLAPNWSIEEKILGEDIYSLSMKAKSFRTGGDGEAMQILKRRAQALQLERGFSSYRILNFSEGIESSTPFTRKISEGTIQLVRAGATPRR